MTKKEYLKICEIIDEQIKDEWITPYYRKKTIDLYGVIQIKTKMEKMIKKE